MKRLLIVFALGLTTAGRLAWAIPSEINYQGTLREKSLPANGNKNITFTLTSADGQTPYSQSITVNTPVTNGLFSVKLNFQLLAGNTWETITPYIKVNVEGQDLTPTEKISPTVYALVSNSVVDGAITTSKLDSSVSGLLVPTGMIAMFAQACPGGWIPYVPLQGKFPAGADGINIFSGGSGGAISHVHNVILSHHSHSVSDQSLQVGIGIRNITWDNNLVIQPSSNVGSFSQSTANQWYGYGNGMTKPAPTGTNSSDVPVIGPKISGGTNYEQFVGPNTTDTQSNMPPYAGIIFCQKQ